MLTIIDSYVNQHKELSDFLKGSITKFHLS